jgi:hypothetical protein
MRPGVMNRAMMYNMMRRPVVNRTTGLLTGRLSQGKTSGNQHKEAKQEIIFHDSLVLNIPEK